MSSSHCTIGDGYISGSSDLHQHSFGLRKINGTLTSGILKNVVWIPHGQKTEVVFTANNPGKTLFHCHQQNHMESGFMMLFNYNEVN